jgi:hypothetical protein
MHATEQLALVRSRLLFQFTGGASAVLGYVVDQLAVHGVVADLQRDGGVDGDADDGGHRHVSSRR